VAVSYPLVSVLEHFYFTKRTNPRKSAFPFFDFYVSAVNAFLDSRYFMRCASKIFPPLLSIKKFQKMSYPQVDKPLYFFPELSKEWKVTVKSDKMLLYN